jgi:hypothetical protein
LGSCYSRSIFLNRGKSELRRTKCRVIPGVLILWEYGKCRRKNTAPSLSWGKGEMAG